MPRLPADIRISLKNPEKTRCPTHRIELVRPPAGKQYWTDCDGKVSAKLPDANVSQSAEPIHRWLVENG